MELTAAEIEKAAVELYEGRHYDDDLADWARKYGLRLLEDARSLVAVTVLLTTPRTAGHEDGELDEPVPGGYIGEHSNYDTGCPDASCRVRTKYMGPCGVCGRCVHASCSGMMLDSRGVSHGDKPPFTWYCCSDHLNQARPRIPELTGGYCPTCKRHTEQILCNDSRTCRNCEQPVLTYRSMNAPTQPPEKGSPI